MHFNLLWWNMDSVSCYFRYFRKCYKINFPKFLFLEMKEKRDWCIFIFLVFKKILFDFRRKKKGKTKLLFVIYASTGCLYMPLANIKAATLAYQDGAPTNWATCSGLSRKAVLEWLTYSFVEHNTSHWDRIVETK